jgi:hypothetical protein
MLPIEVREKIYKLVLGDRFLHIDQVPTNAIILLDPVSVVRLVQPPALPNHYWYIPYAPVMPRVQMKWSHTVCSASVSEDAAWVLCRSEEYEAKARYAPKSKDMRSGCNRHRACSARLASGTNDHVG